MSEQQTHPVDDYVVAVRRRWRSMLGWAVGGVAAGLGITAAMTPVYQAQATLLVPPTETQSSVAAQLGAGTSPVSLMRGIVSSIELQNRVSADTGVPRLQLQEKLTAKAELNRNQLEISMAGPDREQALRVVQSATRRLEELAREQGLGAASRQEAALRKAIQEREKELAAANKALEEFQRGASTATDPTNPASALLYRRQLAATETDIGALDRELAAKRRQARAAGRNPMLPSDLSGALDERSTLLEAELAYETARRQLGDANPQLVRKREDLDEARRNFQREVASRLRATQQGLDAELASLEARRLMLTVQRDLWKQLAEKAPAEAVRSLRLNFEVEALEAVIRALRERADEAAVQSEVDAIRWTILSPPRLLPEPVNKNFGLNAFLGLMVGAFLGGAVSIVRHGH